MAVIAVAAQNWIMIISRFPDDKAKRRALVFLPGRFSFKSWATAK